MPKSLSAEVEVILAPFAKSLGDVFPKVVNDLSSWLGRQDKNITADIGQWKTQSGFRLVAKDKHTASLPANDARTILYWFAIRLNEIQTAGKFKLDATVPENCEAWIARVKVGSHNVPAPTPA